MNQSGYTGTSELWAIEECLQNYNLSIAKNLSKTFPKNPKILDFGAGIGTIAIIMAEFYGKENITCIEVDNDLALILKTRGFKVLKSLLDCDEQFDAIYSSNVLEHIANDQEIVCQLSKKLSPNGVFSVYVPATKFAFSWVDIKLGHHRRYTLSGLKKLMSNANLKIETIKYSDPIGLLAWMWVKFFTAKKHRSLSLEKNSLIFYDKHLLKISIFLERFFSAFLGKNLLVISKAIKVNPDEFT